MPPSAKILFFLTVLFLHHAHAGEDVNGIISRIQKKYDSIRDVSVVFVQDVQFGVTKAEQSFSGKLLMKKGNKYRIEMEQQTIVTDGKSVWSLNKVNNQLLIDNFKDDPKSFTPDKVLVNVPMNYNATLIGKEQLREREVTVLKLVPKNSRANLKWMKIWIDTDEWIMKQIQVMDISDNLMTYHINEITLNSGIADSQFQFESPAGVDVIDLR